MVTYSRIDAHGVYVSGSVDASHGVAFLPSNDTGAASLTLDSQLVLEGFFACWSGAKGTSPAIAVIADALKAAASAANPSDRHFVQFFRTDSDDPLHAISRTGSETGTVVFRPSDASVGDLEYAHSLSLTAGRIDLVDDRLLLTPVNVGANHILRQASSFIVAELGFVLTGTKAGCLTGTTIVPKDRLFRNDFVNVIATQGDVYVDEETGDKLGYFVEDESRQLIVDSIKSDQDGVRFDVCYDPVNALDPDRMHFEFPVGEHVLSALASTEGHDVALVPMVSLGALPRFSYVRRREVETLDNAPSSEKISLVLEGDFEVKYLTGRSSDALDSDTSPRDLGLIIGDSPHEFLADPQPAADTADAAPLVLSLGRGPAYLRQPEPDDIKDETFALAANQNDATIDQMTYGVLKRGEVTGAVVSEARNMRRLGANGSDLKADAFLLRRKDTDADDATDSESIALVPDQMVPILPRADRDTVGQDPETDDIGGLADAAIDALAAALDSSDDKPLLAQRIVQERRKLLTATPQPNTEEAADALDSLGKETFQTPLGFEIKQKGGKVKEVILAQTPQDKKPDVRAKLRVLPASDDEDATIDSSFLDAIVKNQLFVVANRSGGSGDDKKFRLNGTLELSKWGFEVDLWDSWTPAVGAPIVPLVIIKGFEGKSIAELMKESDLWSARSYLQSRDESDAVTYAKSLFDDAVKVAKKTDSDIGKPSPAFRKFSKIINDPTWNGVLVLNIRIPPQVLPNAIKGLLGGIDLDKFRAHHLGIPVRRISGDEPLSKAFAAINYEPPAGKDVTYSDDPSLKAGTIPGPSGAPNGSDGNGYDGEEESKDKERFAQRVKLLRVGFDSGKIQSFTCKVDLKFGAFFHEMFGKDGEIDYKTIGLTGRFVRRDGKETYDFIADTNLEIDLDKIPLIKRVEIDRIIYSTTVSPGPNNTEIVDSRFDINGDVEFKEMDSVDFFSFDKIKFTNLGLDMRFRLPEIGSIGWPKFRFSPGGMLFDFDKIKGGDGDRSFWSSLPLKFTGFGWLGGELNLPKLGFFPLGKSEGTDGTSAPFFLKFDLDLGNLGSFASKLGDFKMELGLVFGFDANNRPFAGLGFRFNGAGGTNLEIGLQGFLKLKCDRYKLVQLEYKKDGVPSFTYYGFMGLNARLIVFGNQIPPKDKDNPDKVASLYIFVNPEELGSSKGVGWLLATKDQFDSSVLKVTTFALGQRVNPFKLPSNERVQTRDVLKKFDDLATGLPNDSGTDVVPLFPDDISFEPDFGWSIGFQSIFYKSVHIGFAAVDPVLAGVLLDVKLKEGGDESLFAIDVLYRKLADDLGVYAIEVELPPSLRNWQFGAVGITIPVIGVEIFTDGNWGVDIGYPRNKDFQRSFAVNVFPFVGAGGFYYRRVDGPASRLIPRAARATDGREIPYNPVTEIGFGMRVGLGVTLAQGILNAGLSVTVYGYLEGAYGKLDYPSGPNTPVTHAKRSYITIWGAVGVMGELYGYVDFGIVKAGVFVQLYVEVGLRLETDRAIELYLEVGVRVKVRVVIARIKVFGKRIEIAISFSFGTTVRFSRFIGSNRNQQYYIRDNMAVDALDQDGPDPTELRPMMDWTKAPSPSHWGLTVEQVPIEVALQPDLTIAPAPDNTPEVHAVYLMATKLTPADDQSPAPIERLVQGLCAWAICSGLEIEPDELETLGVSPDELNIVAENLATPGRSGPNYDEITAFLAKHFPARTEAMSNAEPAENPDEAPRGALMPLPHSLTISMTTDEMDDNGDPVKIERSLGEHRFVTPGYRALLEQAIDRFVHFQNVQPPSSLDDDTPLSLASVLTEEWVEMIMRAGIAELVDRLTDDLSEDDSDVVLFASDLIGMLLENPRLSENNDAEGGGPDDVQPLRSAAEDIAVTAGRFFAYGQRLPEPESGEGEPAPGQEQSPPDRDRTAVPEERFFHAMHRLAGNQFAISNATRIGVKPNLYDGWLKVNDDVDTGEIDAGEIAQFKADANSWAQGDEELQPGAMFREQIRRVSLGTPAQSVTLGALVPGVNDKLQLWMLSPEALEVLAQLEGAPEIAAALPASGKARKFTAQATGFRAAIVLDVAIKRPKTLSPTGEGAVDPASTANAFEIAALPEPLRRLLDPFAPIADGGSTSPPEITGVRVYKPSESGFDALSDNEEAPITIVQSNLSATVAPESGILDDDTDNRIAPIADRVSDPIGFVRLLRQAALVNTGGYSLSYPGAEEDLADLVDNTSQDDPVNAAGRIRVVIGLADDDSSLKFANALLNDETLGLEEGVAAPTTTVVGINAGEIRAPLHDPGVIPVQFTRGLPDEDAADWHIQERFSNLALDVSVFGADGTPLGTPQYADQAVAIAPDYDEDAGKNAPRVYKVSIPAARIAFGAASDTSPYALVGGKVQVGGVWRDIYGNTWSERFKTIEIPVTYSDRLTGLVGLPHLKVSYWPTGNGTIKLGLESRFDALAELDSDEAGIDDEPVPMVWLRQRLREIDRDISLLRRARMQILDVKLEKLALSCPLGKADVAPDRVAAHLEETIASLAEIRSTFDLGLPHEDGTDGLDRARLRALLAAKVSVPNGATKPDHWHFTEQSVQFGGVAKDNFSEFDVSLTIQRREPSEDDDWYHTEVFDDKDGDLKEIWKAVQVIPPNLVGDHEAPRPVEMAGFGGTSAGLLLALSKFTSDHRIALGYGAEPAVVERAIWLIRRDYMDKLTAKEIYKNVEPVPFAFPPVKNAPFSAELPLAQRGEAETVLRSVLDVDADAFGQTALDRIETLLSPAVTVPLLNGVADDADKRTTLRDTIGSLLQIKEGLAGNLAERAGEVFVEDFDAVPVGDRRERMYAQITDMLRRDLRRYYRLTTLLSYFVEDDHSVQPPANLTVAHGKLLQTTTGEGSQLKPENAQVKMTAFNVPLGSSEGEVSPDLFVGCEISPNGDRDHYDAPASLDITHVQRLERPDLSKDDVSYRDAAWLELYAPPNDEDPWTRIKLSETDRFVPNVIRELPKPPRIDEERFEAAGESEPSVTVREARQWTSLRDINWQAGPSDRLYCNVRYQSQLEVDLLDSGQDLAQLLVTFVLETDSEMPAILEAADIDAYAWVASRAARLLTAQAEAFDALDDDKPLLDEAIFEESVSDVGKRQIEAHKIKLTTVDLGEGENLDYRAFTYRVPDGEPDEFDPILFVNANAGATDLPGAEEPNTTGFSTREIGTQGLDILTHGSAETEIWQTRNEEIKGKPLHSSFIYELPHVSSGEPIVPVIDRTLSVLAGELEFKDGLIELGEPTDKGTIRHALETFLDQLLKPLPKQESPPTWTDLVFEYESGLFTAEEGGPVILVRSNLEASDTKVMQANIKAMAEDLKEWLENRPALSTTGVPRGRLLVDARVYVQGADPDDERLIMRLRRCVFKFVKKPE